MDFEKNRQGFCEKESSSSSFRGPANFGNTIPWEFQLYENQYHQAGAAAAPKIDIMDVGSSSVEREHMFDKVVTPSDVGKLNRLVVPKQYAEKYFPLDSAANEKCLLLNFEDRNGKPWRFRYSYWNSSQSYVMTKGWSRFVKEKRLDAGDVVSFQRGIGELGKDHLYIDYRRRPELFEPPSILHHRQFAIHTAVPWNPLLLRPRYTANIDEYGNVGGYGNSVNAYDGSVYYMRRGGFMPQIGQGGAEPTVFNSPPVVHGNAAAKKLRLFGVNMECAVPEVDDECEILSSTMVSPQPSYLQLRLYDGTPVSSVSPGLMNKGKNSMSLDLDM